MNARTAQVFVYYRVRAADAAAAIAAVKRFQAGLQATMPGLSCSLARRVDDGTEPPTLMETYSHASAAVATWQHEVERQAVAELDDWIVGERHVETFEPCA